MGYNGEYRRRGEQEYECGAHDSRHKGFRRVIEHRALIVVVPDSVESVDLSIKSFLLGDSMGQVEVTVKKLIK